MQENWITLAVIGQPHGVSGRVKVKSFTDPEDDFAHHSALTYADGTAVKLKLTGHAQGMVIIAIEGVTNRNQAELLRGKKIGIVRDALPVLDDPNQFYITDLIGMEVVDTSGQPFGRVHNVANYGAGDILDIERNGGTEMYAFTSTTFPAIDREARRITIDPPVILGSREEEQQSPHESA